MPLIEEVRCILLSSPYADADHPEIKECYPNGPKRTIGMVEVTLSNGVKGLGEGYLAVFAPLVFKSIVDLCAPYMIGKDASDIARRVRDLRSLCDYWSLQGAARHVIGAFEIALHDANAKARGVPVHEFLGGSGSDSVPVYGSGGCCGTKEHFIEEMEILESMGIRDYKIRSVSSDVRRTAWVLNEAGARNIRVGVDMCQNLADPPQSASEVVSFVEAVHERTAHRIKFIEEAIGPDDPAGFKELRSRTDVPVCGGEIITTPKEMIDRIKDGVYDFVQPDASVIGGMSPVLEIFRAARENDVGVVVHAWSGAVAMMANYHASFVGGGCFVEFPLLEFPVCDEMLGDHANIVDGQLRLPEALGLGVTLTKEIESRYPFDETAVYSCMLNDWGPPPDSYWE